MDLNRKIDGSTRVERIDDKNINIVITSDPVVNNIDSLKKKLVILQQRRGEMAAMNQKNLADLDEEIVDVTDIINKARDLGVE